MLREDETLITDFRDALAAEFGTRIGGLVTTPPPKGDGFSGNVDLAASALAPDGSVRAGVLLKPGYSGLR